MSSMPVLARGLLRTKQAASYLSISEMEASTINSGCLSGCCRDGSTFREAEARGSRLSGTPSVQSAHRVCTESSQHLQDSLEGTVVLAVINETTCIARSSSYPRWGSSPPGVPHEVGVPQCFRFAFLSR